MTVLDWENRYWKYIITVLLSFAFLLGSAGAGWSIDNGKLLVKVSGLEDYKDAEGYPQCKVSFAVKNNTKFYSCLISNRLLIYLNEYNIHMFQKEMDEPLVLQIQNIRATCI